MAAPIVLQQEFHRMVQDQPRYRLPRTAAWNLQDWIPDLGASLRKRGGWSYASASISAQATSAAYVTTVIYAPFSAGDKIIATTDNSKVVSVTPSSEAVAQVTATGTSPISSPIFYGGLVVFPSPDGSTASSVKSYDGTTYQTLTGSPPLGKYVCVWKDRLYLACTSANPTYVYISDLSDPTSWSTGASGRWFRASQNVTGLAPLPNALMVFTEKMTVRVRGSIPPASGGASKSDFTYDDPIFNIGCTDARSIAVNGPYGVFANPTGVYMTNGTNIPEDLTETCGVKRLWQTQLASYASASWTLAAGIFRNLYIINVMNGSTFVDCFVFDVRERHAFRLTNVKALMFASAVRVGEELYAASRATDRILGMSTMWSPASGVKNDEDGTAVTPVLETPFYFVPSSKKRFKYLHTHYDLRDAATDNPVLTVSYAVTPDGSYTALSPTLAETTDHLYEKLPLRVKGHGMALKYAQSNASSDTRIAAIMADVRDREGSRRN